MGSETESIRTDDDLSEEVEVHVRLVTKEDICFKESRIENAGRGVFCKKNIKAGTILPYYAVVKKLADVGDESDSYFMTVKYVNEEDRSRSISSMIADGNPTLPTLKKLSRHLRAAAYVNEASTSPPNCVFVNNTCLSKQDIISAYRAGKSIPITLLVIPHDLDEGDELLTMYGSDYEREYKIWRDRKGYRDAIIDLAHDIVRTNAEDLKKILQA